MKKIEVLHLKPSQLKHDFGNPRKITESKKEELKKSLEKYGDHDLIKIDESHNIISGNQRVKAMIEIGIDTPILCKKLVGYSEKELKAINIKSNEHYGEWDYDLLSEWQHEISDIDFDVPVVETESDYLTTTQKSKYLQDNMLIKIGNIEMFIKKDLQPKEFDVFFKDINNNIEPLVIYKLSELANEIRSMG